MNQLPGGSPILELSDVSGTTEDLNGNLQAMVLKSPRRQHTTTIFSDGAETRAILATRKKEINKVTRELLLEFMEGNMTNIWMYKLLGYGTF